MPMKTILITNDPLLAAEAEHAGVSRIMVDLESHGKQERQASRITFISSHRPEDIAPVRAVLTQAELIVRINPWHAGSPAEIAGAIEAGADRIMLPMIEAWTHIASFVAALAGTGVRPFPLIETRYSMEHLEEIADLPGIDEVFIGLNDLHLSLGLDFLFEPLAMGLVDRMAEQLRARGKPFGFGGIGAMEGSGELPAESVLAEHVRLGSSCVILSSRFDKDIRRGEPEGRAKRLAEALQALHNKHALLSQRSAEATRADAAETADMIRQLAQTAKQRRASS